MSADFVRVEGGFSLPSSSVTLHEPVFVDFTLRNVEGGSLRVDLGPDLKDHFEFSIVEPADLVRGALRYPKNHGADRASRLGDLSLGPGKAFSHRLLLDEWWHFEAPGDYVVEALLADSIRTSDGRSMGRMPEDLLEIHVAPRDPARLAEVCEALASRALSEIVSESFEAALALGHVRDPIALSYLERVLVPGRSTWQFALPGLARIGTAEALAILEAWARKGDEGASLARWLLHEARGAPSRR
jgi:hypothetical protein